VRGVCRLIIILSHFAQGRGGTLIKQLIRQQAALLRHFAQIGFTEAFLHPPDPSGSAVVSSMT